MLLARLRAAHEQLAAEELLVVQLGDGAFRFFDGLHLHEGETFRALVVFVGHDFRVLHLADAVEELEEIALGRFEGQVADVKTRRGDFDDSGLRDCGRGVLMRQPLRCGCGLRGLRRRLALPFPLKKPVIFSQSVFLAGALGVLFCCR